MIQDIFDQKWKSISDRHLVEPPFQITPNVAAFSRSVNAWLFETSWTAAYQASLSFSISQSLLKLMSIESMIPFNHLILSPLLLHQGLSSESALHIKYWNFNFSISPCNEYLGLTSFRICSPCFQGTFKSLLQHHSSKASILQCLAYFGKYLCCTP